MHQFLVIALVALAVCFLLSWIVGRFHSGGGTFITLVAGLVGRLAVVVAMAYSTEKALHRGGWFVALAVLFVVIGLGAVMTSVFTAGALWLLVTGRAPD